MRTLRIPLLAVLTSLGTLAMADQPENAPFRVRLTEFPNPFSDHITITIPVGLRGNTRVDIRDEAGRTVMSWPLGLNSAAGTPVTLDTPSLTPGVYALSVIDEVGDEASATLIKV